MKMNVLNNENACRITNVKRNLMKFKFQIVTIIYIIVKFDCEFVDCKITFKNNKRK